ncbi:TIGR00341 family protein [Salinirubellus salinus]|uniref:TIGR00341 family protein n=1 Tax=Salinirubellus salinus TaxID=1364945 RepID=A0A9E7R1J5_9EURY|nr:TIGR00341 family protein [Salinirubellus salinus]UWM54036.1 TIGR00341 family protein [Salinirubellus salinus]
MRLVQVLVPKGKIDPVLTALDELDIDCAVFPEIGRGEFEAMVQFPVPPGGVETVLEELSEAGIREDSYTIVLATETVVSQRLPALEARFPGLRISREELHARAQDLAPANSTFFAFIVLSTVIATTGLLLDSAATIIGAMVVAPLMGPAISASVGTVLDDAKMASRGVRLQVSGLVVAILVGAALGWVFQQTVLVPPDLDITEVGQIAERTSPNFLSLFLALGSGIAGAISIMRGAGSSLVGVAIAVALVPPAATAGLGIAWGLPLVTIAAAVLVVVNLLAINISALVIFSLSGFQPIDLGQVRGSRRRLASRIAIIGVSILLLSVVLGAVTWTSVQTESVRTESRAVVESVFAEATVDEAEIVLLEVDVEYSALEYLAQFPVRVDILVGLPPTVERPPDFAQTFDDLLSERTGREHFVRVGFIDEQVSDATGRDPNRLFEVVENETNETASPTPTPDSARLRGPPPAGPLDPLAERSVRAPSWRAPDYI